jgi:hypothetical protein
MGESQLQQEVFDPQRLVADLVAWACKRRDELNQEAKAQIESLNANVRSVLGGTWEGDMWEGAMLVVTYGEKAKSIVEKFKRELTDVANAAEAELAAIVSRAKLEKGL